MDKFKHYAELANLDVWKSVDFSYWSSAIICLFITITDWLSLFVVSVTIILKFINNKDYLSFINENYFQLIWFD